MIFKVFDQLENLIPVWKCTEIELPSVSGSNNLIGLTFLICLHPGDDFAIICRISQNINYFSAIMWKEKENKVNSEELRSCCFVLTIVKHPVFFFNCKLTVLKDNFKH